MKVYELAKELGTESADICDQLGLKSHLSSMTEIQEKQVRASNGSGAVDDGTVHFFSWNCNQQCAHSNGNLRFTGHKFIAKKGSAEERVIRDSGSPYIYEVTDKPLESEDAIVEFSEKLRGCVKTGDKGEESLVRGMRLLLGLLRDEEASNFIGKKRNSLSIIRNIVNNKSLKSILEK